jgi:hypothetical protein
LRIIEIDVTGIITQPIRASHRLNWFGLERVAWLVGRMEVVGGGWGWDMENVRVREGSSGLFNSGHEGVARL